MGGIGFTSVQMVYILVDLLWTSRFHSSLEEPAVHGSHDWRDLYVVATVHQ